MPSIQFSLPHTLEAEEVVGRLKTFLAKLRERNESKFLVKSEQWNGHNLKCSFSSYGFAMDADVQVEPKDLKFHVNVPFAAMMFKGQIEERLRGELTKLLS
jgi:hypothetical protein